MGISRGQTGRLGCRAGQLLHLRRRSLSTRDRSSGEREARARAGGHAAARDARRHLQPGLSSDDVVAELLQGGSLHHVLSRREHRGRAVGHRSWVGPSDALARPLLPAAEEPLKGGGRGKRAACHTLRGTVTRPAPTPSSSHPAWLAGNRSAWRLVFGLVYRWMEARRRTAVVGSWPGVHCVCSMGGRFGGSNERAAVHNLSLSRFRSDESRRNPVDGCWD